MKGFLVSLNRSIRARERCTARTAIRDPRRRMVSAVAIVVTRSTATSQSTKVIAHKHSFKHPHPQIKNAPPDPLGGALGRRSWDYLSAGFRSTNQTIAGFVNAAVCGADVPATDRGK